MQITLLLQLIILIHVILTWIIFQLYLFHIRILLPTPSLVSDNAEVTDPDLKTSHRMKNRHPYLDQYYCGVASTSCSTFSTPYPMHLFVSYDNCSPYCLLS